ncbi:S1 family peptidase [Bacteroides intestinalis]|uniref:S1 family peptidase n=1 Tax=Bacteroides intestinalis TaxID=329854 RepID=UPI0022E52A5E|nr:trypsin-like peptidase domain-containing protein [Bacteroides intestinalis]
MKVFFSGLLLLVIVTSCNSKKTSYTQEQLYEKFASGVVLIQNTYYYKIILSDENFYSSSYIISDADNLNFEEDYKDTNFDEISNDAKSITFGTGFLISQRGTIVTNSHVINPHIDKKEIYLSLITHLQNELDDANRNLNILENSNSDSKFINIYKERINYLEKEICLKKYEIKLYSKIKVAYNGSRITSSKDLINCFVIKDVPDYDLGIIQLSTYDCWNEATNNNWIRKSKNINQGQGWTDDKEAYEEYCSIIKGNNIVPNDKHIFDLQGISSESNNEENKLYMIGFNEGLGLAITNEGIKAQITQGNISQKTDSLQIMYSIPALHGSSGSPVINQYGELIAINFAGLDDTQGFNYGIRVERLKEILNDKSVKEFMKIYKKKQNAKVNADSLDMIEEATVK